jgi:hypothetical protein
VRKFCAGKATLDSTCVMGAIYEMLYPRKVGAVA